MRGFFHAEIQIHYGIAVSRRDRSDLSIPACTRRLGGCGRRPVCQRNVYQRIV
jgi:hypothetical protein